MADALLTESGDVLLAEGGDALLLEESLASPTFSAHSRTANIWFELQLAKFPVSEGTTTYRWSRQPYADAASFKEGRLISISRAKRAATDINGNYNFGQVSITLEDADGFLRGLLEQGTPTEYFLNREGGVYLLSPEGRAAGLDPRILFRGWVSNVQTLKGRLVRIDLADIVGSQFSGFNLDKTIPSVKLTDISPTIVDALKDKVLPIYAGEFSDSGAVDVNGNPAEKGLVPCFDLGLIDATDPGTPPTPVYAAVPVITASSVVGTGDQTYTYAVTLINPLGETLPSATVTVSSAPATSIMDLSNYVHLEGTYDPGVALTNRVRILGRHGTATWLDEAFLDPGTGTWFYNDGAHDLSRIDIDIEKAYVGPTSSGAIVDDNIWNIIGICLGYSYDILNVFGSDLADGTEPKRINLSAFVGSEILLPTSGDWPFPNPWIEKNGITFTGFLARGPRLRHHQEGVVTFAASICGPHDDADNVIDQAFPQLLWFLNEHVAKNGGTGYRTGVYWPLETYANGDALFQTSKFTEKQALTAEWLGTSLGYLSSIWLTEPITVREVVRRFCLTFGCRLAHNHFGQVFPLLVATPDDPTTGRHLRDRIEIKFIGDPVLAHDETLNRILYHYHMDPDAGDYRNKNIEVENATSIAAHTPGGVVGGSDRRGVKQDTDPRSLFYTNDEATAADVVARELDKRQRRSRYVPVTLDLAGLEQEIDAIVRFTHYDGLGVDGDVAMQGIVLEHETDASDTENPETTLLIQDVRTFVP